VTGFDQRPVAGRRSDQRPGHIALPRPPRVWPVREPPQPFKPSEPAAPFKPLRERIAVPVGPVKPRDFWRLGAALLWKPR
jgi:hypothetical protein